MATSVFFAGILLAAFPAASAQYAAIAYSSDGSQWGWARKQTQKLADQAALVGCNQSSPKKDCEITATKALDLAQGSKHFGCQSALRFCGAGDCQVVGEFTVPRFLAVARTKNEESAPYFYVADAHDNSDAADQAAISGCARRAKEDCRLARVGQSQAKSGRKNQKLCQHLRPAGTRRAVAPPPSASDAVRSAPTAIASVSYENGCRIRVQVSPRFDPFRNQWIYPAPSC